VFTTEQTVSGGHLARRQQVKLFLAGYFVLVVGLVLGLWQTGVLTRVSPVWIAHDADERFDRIEDDACSAH